MAAEHDHPECIYIVDDDLGMRHALERLFMASGWKSRTFASGEALLAISNGRDAACFVIDLHLPGLSGFELWAELSREGLDRPVVFITAHDQPSNRLLAEQIGAAGYFVKPFSGRKLVATAERAIRHR